MEKLLNTEESRKALIFGDGELKKATLTYMQTETKKKVTIPVQFNPTNYSISRSVDWKEKKGLSEDSKPDNVQTAGSNLATLQVKLILDTTTEFPDYVIKPKLKEYLNDSKELTKICREIALLSKKYPDDHIPSSLTFSWGSLEFEGHLSSLTTSYQMFNRNGEPVRVELDMTILGEEKEITTIMERNPDQSPDRTKYRQLQQKDELWMLAYEEYGTVSSWKEIAKENDILNPRKIDYTKGLRVPAL